jgi:hypothetical protein
LVFFFLFLVCLVGSFVFLCVLLLPVSLECLSLPRVVFCFWPARFDEHSVVTQSSGKRAGNPIQRKKMLRYDLYINALLKTNNKTKNNST